MKTGVRKHESEVRRQGLQVRYKLFLTILFALISLLPLSDSYAAPGDFLLKWGSEYNFNNPSGVAVDSSGNVYVADTGNSRIQKFTSAGGFITKWGSPGTGNGQFSYPSGIAVDSSGNIYVADSYNHRIQKFTSSGTYITQWGGYGTGNGQFNNPYGIAVDSSGNVYVADYINHRIQKFTSSGGFITKWGSSGTGNGQLNYPRGIAVDSAGNVYVADTQNHRIQKFTSSGTYITQWGGYGTGNGQFNNPNGITVDSGGNVYVAELSNHRIQKFTGSGGFITKWGTQGSGNGYFQNPSGVAVDSDGNVYVADTYNYRIQKFTSSGGFIAKWESSGSGNGQFNYPRGIAVDSSGNVYVADSYNHRIQKFTSSGTYITQWGGYGTGNGQFSYPSGIAVDSSGNVYVADYINHRIQKFTSSGTYITQWGGYGTGNGQFNNPYGIAVDSSCNVYVADSSNHRIQKFTSSGTFITKWGSYGSGNGQFNYPHNIAVDRSGNVFVTEYTNNRIQVFTSTGTYIWKWGSQGDNPGQFRNPSGISMDRCGSKVYVADTNNHRIQAFEGYGATGTLTANAGPDQTVEQTSPTGASVTLDGSGSTAECGGELSYSWTWSGGSATGANPTVTMPSGTTIVTLTVTSGGSSATDTVTITVQDTIKPVTTAVITGTAGDNSWFISDVNISLSATDSGSGVKEIRHSIDGGSEVITAGSSASFNLTSDGNHTVSYYAVDNALNSETAKNIDIKLDKTPPVITAVPSPAPNANGWNNADVAITFNCTDSASGIASCTLPVTVMAEGAGQTVNGSAKDIAGNTASTSATLNIDKTMPTITGSTTTSPNANGWYKTDVTVHFSAADALSGIDNITPDVTVSTEGSSQSVNGTAFDKAGNSAGTAVSGIHIDKTSPTITITGVADGAVYTLGAVPVAGYTASDTLSGVAAESSNLAGGNANGVGLYTYTVDVTDKAGNAQTAAAKYTVVYTFSGFLPPVNLGKPFKLGSTIPIKFQLMNADGNYISTANATIMLQMFSGSEPVGEPIEAVSTSGADTGNTFRYSAIDNQYIYNLNTRNLSQGTWQIIVRLDDGTVKTALIFLK